VIAMASGASGVSPGEAALTAALTKVCDELARSMVADGEGANHVAEIKVFGLATRADAKAAAKTIATSMLVKTALFGEDINWGRLLAAAGRAGVAFDPSRAAISVGGVAIVKDGAPVGAEAEKQANEILKRPSYSIELRLGDGPGEFRYLTSDLGHAYIDVNAGYRS
jgi:glutamate N-acetyltransferase / amino-acid N-acetyltransferase